jgi:hypothetical protein
MRLHEALQFAVDSRRNDEALPSQSLDFFLKSFEKGSKPFRRILRYKENSKLKIRSLNTVKTFFELVGFQQPEDDIVRSCWGDWQKFFTVIDAKSFCINSEITYWVQIKELTNSCRALTLNAVCVL